MHLSMGYTVVKFLIGIVVKFLSRPVAAARRGTVVAGLSVGQAEATWCGVRRAAGGMAVYKRNDT